jgi:hypothetical protein
MSSCVEFYNITNLPEIIDYTYNRYAEMNIIVCGVFILTSLTNICMIGSINKKINNISQRINNVFNPPEYK